MTIPRHFYVGFLGYFSYNIPSTSLVAATSTLRVHIGIVAPSNSKYQYGSKPLILEKVLSSRTHEG